jgi:hypothetical protein
MAKLQEPEERTLDVVTPQSEDFSDDDYDVGRSSSPISEDGANPPKALRTVSTFRCLSAVSYSPKPKGTIPYMSFNVLHGRKHTRFDDMESFLYVVFLFFFSYTGPLSKEELRDADARGFVQPTGSGRFTHTRRWPDVLEKWSDARQMYTIAQHKDANLATQDGVTDLLNHPEVKHSLRQNWASGLQEDIKRLLFPLWRLFVASRICVLQHTCLALKSSINSS